MTIGQQIQAAEATAKAAKKEVILLVAQARADGLSWQDIANILGCSRQNARVRFSKYLEESTVVTIREDLL